MTSHAREVVPQSSRALTTGPQRRCACGGHITQGEECLCRRSAWPHRSKRKWAIRICPPSSMRCPRPAARHAHPRIHGATFWARLQERAATFRFAGSSSGGLLANATAFTVGHNIVLGPGAPADIDSREGRRFWAMSWRTSRSNGFHHQPEDRNFWAMETEDRTNRKPSAQQGLVSEGGTVGSLRHNLVPDCAQATRKNPKIRFPTHLARDWFNPTRPPSISPDTLLGRHGRCGQREWRGQSGGRILPNADAARLRWPSCTGSGGYLQGTCRLWLRMPHGGFDQIMDHPDRRRRVAAHDKNGNRAIAEQHQALGRGHSQWESGQYRSVAGARHELCGHAWLGQKGLRYQCHARRGRSPETVARENELRKEHGIEARGSFKDPFAGNPSGRPRPAPVRFSGPRIKKCQCLAYEHLPVAQDQRQDPMTAGAVLDERNAEGVQVSILEAEVSWNPPAWTLHYEVSNTMQSAVWLVI